MTKDLVSRVKDLLTSPKTEWDVIDGESVEPQSLITSYVAPLAAIPAIAGFIGMSVFGIKVFGETYRTGLFSGIGTAIVTFIFAIIFVFVFAFIINALAPTFGAKKNFNQALKVSAFAPTAGWVAGAFQIIPMLAIVGFIGAIYSLYLIFVGLPKMMKPPEDKAMTYTIASIAAAFVVALILGFFASKFMPNPAAGVFSANNSGSAASKRLGGGATAGSLEARAKAMEKAAESGDISAIIGAMAGVDGNAPLVDGDALRALAPSKLAGLERQSLEVESLQAPFKMVSMTARYASEEYEDAKRIELKITNSPMVAAASGFSGFTGATYDRSTSDGFERLKRKGDQMIIEEWNKTGKYGKYGRSIGKGFMVEAEGSGIEFSVLKRAVEDISERKLNALPKAE